jgi:lipoprotein-releasing system permease protein
LNLPLFIAKKYFFSKKKRNFINVISIISMAGVAVGTMSLVVVLSVFNGLEGFIRSLYSSFDPDIKVLPVKGKSFVMDSLSLQKINSIEGISFVSEVIEDNAYVKFRDSEMVVKLKGVDQHFLRNERLGGSIVEGNLILENDNLPLAIIGRGVQYTLNISDINDFYPLQFYYPKRKRSSALNPGQLTNRRNINIGGVFAIEKQYDMNYIVVPLKFASRLMDYGRKRTALEINVSDESNIETVKLKIQDILGASYTVLDSDQQHSSLIMAIKIEKLFVFITFSFIIAVAAINIFFSLTMLAIEKKKDIAVLYALGSGRNLVRSIFLHEGAIISFSGAIVGMILGILLCLVQQQFGIISMGVDTSVIDAYPVEMKLNDFILSSISIVLITLIFSARPAFIASRSTVVDQL